MTANRPDRGGVQIIELDDNDMPLLPEPTISTVEDNEEDIETAKLKQLITDERKERRIKKILRGTLKQATERALAWAEQRRLQEIAQQSPFLMDESKKRQMKKLVQGNLKRGSDEATAWIPRTVPVMQAGLHPSPAIDIYSPLIFGHTSSKPVRKSKQ
ncbi:uncharacterized protein [Anabrus simplex]|uniref:uncharacterized protein n=1 Tax=Anabrus simplex TaxID=316456 RepID=UPI0035A37AD4